MTRPMSRAERKTAFMKKAEEMFTELEEWYDHNPAASFEEIEQQARQMRRMSIPQLSCWDTARWPPPSGI